MVRVFTLADGREVVHFDQHSDWVFGACFTLDGKSVISASRDRTMKLIDASDGRLLDEICRPNEPLIGVVRHPTENLVASLGAEARVRVFKAQSKPDNNDPNADPNFVREYEHFDGGVTAATYSLDGKWFAVAGAPAGEVRVHHGETPARQARLKGHEGLVFGLAFSPDGKRLATAGFEGVVRIFAWEKESLEAIFTPVSPESDFTIGNQSATHPP
jgi:WD40 repeat protein